MRHLFTGITGVLLAVSLTAVAQDEYSAVEGRMRLLAPNAESIAVSETPVEGILMVQINTDIVYTSTDGRYLFQGRVIDLDTREDLTEAAMAGMRKELLTDLDTSGQIRYSPEDPSYELMVFTDIDCGYCRKLHAQMAEYNEQGIAISYMAFPRAGVGSKSYEKAVSVWCADDPAQAMTQAKMGSDPDPEHCENPVAEQYQLGMKLGVTGTPALMTADGVLIPGYVPPEKLRQRLDAQASVTAD